MNETRNETNRSPGTRGESQAWDGLNFRSRHGESSLRDRLLSRSCLSTIVPTIVYIHSCSAVVGVSADLQPVLLLLDHLP
jgi:hypothetical protein